LKKGENFKEVKVKEECSHIITRNIGFEKDESCKIE